MKPDLNQLREIFKQMSKDGFDIEKPLKWGFYFVDIHKSRLENLYQELEPYNYVIEKFTKDKDGEWTLMVSKIECLVLEKLHRRNIAFNELADGCSVNLYDGWDVENI